MHGNRQWKALSAPDPERPHWIFIDGPDAYEVAILQAGFPLFGVQGGGPIGGGIGDTLYVLGGSLLAYWIDPGCKVVVSRLRNRRPHWWRVVSLEFTQTDEEAEELQRAIVASWRLGQFTGREPLNRQEIARLRSEHRRQSVPDPAERSRLSRKQALRLGILTFLLAACSVLIAIDGVRSDLWTAILPTVLAAVAGTKAWRAWRQAHKDD